MTNDIKGNISTVYDNVADNLLLYQEMFIHAPIGIIRTSLDGQLLDANPAFYQLLGYDAEDKNNISIKNIAKDLYVNPEKRNQLIDITRHLDNISHFQVRFKGKGDREIPCNVHVRASRNEDGTIRYLEGFIENIETQLRTAQELQESEARYRSIFENTGAGTIIIEPDTTISKVNTSFARLFGLPKKAIEGKMKWPEFIANESDRERMIRYHYLRRRHPQNVPIEYEFILRNQKGELRNIYLRVDMIGDTEQSVASLFDITSQKNAYRHLKTSEEKLSVVLEAFEGFIYTSNLNYTLTYVNKLLQEIHHNAVGTICYKTLYGFDRPCDWCKIEQVFAGKTVKSELQNPINCRWYYAVSSPVYDDSNVIQEMQSVLIDIHERKEKELQIREKDSYLEKENVRLRATIQERYKFGKIIGKSKKMQKVYELILRAAASDANVIIYGESGTGKELVARAIHDMSERAGKEFVPINCNAIPANLMETEFFGYKKGAFTGADRDKKGLFEQAYGGTLFLDELGEISEEFQIKLLRALEGGGYTPVGSVEWQRTDVRIIAATNRNLAEMVDKGCIREDFFYRIHILPIHIPPLRERREDIPLLVEHFIKKYGSRTSPTTISGHDVERLVYHDWPGNVRELENTLQRFINLRYLDFTNLRSRYQDDRDSTLAPEIKIQPLGDAVQEFERTYILKLLTQNKWNRTKVAALLGIERKTLYLKMQRMGIQHIATNSSN